MVTLESHGRSRHSKARKSHRLPAADTEILDRARFVSVETCLESCRADFVASDLGVKSGAAFVDVCSVLTFAQPREVFWKLYCCDSSRCGVHMDRGGPLEQSPNVDLLINQCRDHGFYEIYDPGPPAITCGKPSSFALPAQPSPSSSGSIPSLPVSTHTAPPAPAESNPQSSTTVAVPNIPSSPGGLSQGAKAAVGICCSVAIIALLTALLLMRRRRRSNKGYLKSPPSPKHHHTRAEAGPQSGSHSPLITPPPLSSSKVMPVTPPPPRLSDRRYLVSMSLGPDPAQSGRRSSPAATVFPRAPVCSPTGKKLAPRPEKHLATSSSGNGILSDLTQKAFPLRGAPHSSPNGQDSPTGASSPATEYSKFKPTDSATGTPPLSPSRPRRPHDSLLEISTVRPASKPPTWSLPTPPRSVRHTRAPASPTSPASPVLPVSPLSTAGPTSLPATFLAQTTPRQQHGELAATPEPDKGPTAPRGAQSEPSRESSELDESYVKKRRDTRVSWGSWGGTAFARLRATEKGPQSTDGKKGTGGPAVPLQELNLEALGGSY